jgi:outer membrane protein
MKKLALMVSAVSYVGVVALFVSFLTSCSGKSNEASPVSGSGEIKIAYILTDSVLVNYQMAIDLHQDFMSQQQQYNTDFGKKRELLEKQAAAFQEKLQRGGFLNEERAMSERDRLLSQQDEMKRMDYDLSTKLSQMEATINQRLADSITSYVKEYNKNHNYTYILSNTGNIIVGDQRYNISKEILDGLNARYKASK